MLCKLYKGLRQKFYLSPGSVTQAIQRVNLQIKMSLQSLNQSMTFSSFGLNGWKWCDDKLIMVPVWFTRGQLPATVMKRSQKVKETKNDVYLSDDNLADDEEALHNQREKEREK